MDERSEDVVVTTHHLYRKSERIGVGASCEVYKGIHKDTCRTRALKVFITSFWAGSLELHREISALQKLKHKNIVGYYGQEEEINSGRRIIVLELCSGGSLHSCLQEPEHVHGLPDKDFLLLIDHLGAGIQYLNGEGFLHRDIKPGNVLLDVALDGTITFKLSDFGTSRQIADGEEFLSLVGTEEYLHPDMYERAFVNKQKPAGYNSSADAWSLGCTLIHACTGDVPFKPFGGSRHNRDTMFQMIKHKPPGAISGVQIVQHGAISWRKTLPDTCNITKNLRQKVEPVINDLLQCSSRITSFLINSSKLLQMILVFVINADEATQISLYIPPCLSYEELMDQLAAILDVSAHSQLSFVKGQLLSHLMKDNSTVGAVIEPGDVIIAMSLRDVDAMAHSHDGIDPYPGFPEAPSPQEDVKVALKCSTTVFKIRELVTDSVLIQRQLKNAASFLKSHLQSVLEKVERFVGRLTMKCDEMASRLRLLAEMEEQRNRCTHVPNTSVMHRSKTAHALSARYVDQNNKT
ncbi:serine/threonine-protein kinase TBK1-like [Gigantopelta aegis]|uniref:serine/threonine-protein kinase TBK1-like n=1 Tax=Gigantopelta aegis TaxID=1735272 RepID=UPI001B88AD2F|nr:serine/threonine-protein kinase TBK1-like [Gigantopelta aegis]XP_041349810.1 serine/threonine-protein kinase TBK1-like [Gigantopelta aegis]XP_041349811.1 serine/threonine-protein kinase TBK1-like [Gigantopelta aegis]XP_041349812.1 serine/threonine-protein kinase TBK1-like [Gigantopelta aegis]